MNYNEIIRALVLIRDICASTTCENCLFKIDGVGCGITNDDPAYWNITDIDSWRAFK